MCKGCALWFPLSSSVLQLPGVLREVTTEFTVDARSLTTTGGSHVTARVLNPSGAKTDTYVTDLGDGTYRVQYTAYEEGEDRWDREQLEGVWRGQVAPI